MKMHAIGSNIARSYNGLFRKLTKLSRKTSSNFTLQSKQAETSEAAMPVELILAPPAAEDQVAMDFSGKNGKLVTNCKEIEVLRNTRKHRRLSQRMSGNPITQPTTNTDVDLDADLSDASWFHGVLSREEASTLMKEEGLEHGLFMVRKSCKDDQIRYILTFCMNEQIHHFQILQEMNDNTILYCLANGLAFPSVDNLIEHYRQKPLNGLSVALRKPCQKRRKSLTLPTIPGADD